MREAGWFAVSAAVLWAGLTLLLGEVR